MKARVYGGKLQSVVVGTPIDVEKLVVTARLLGIKVGKSEDLSELRAKGACVHRAELDNQPEFEGYCGPMWDGGCLRYETWEIYNAFSD